MRRRAGTAVRHIQLCCHIFKLKSKMNYRREEGVYRIGAFVRQTAAFLALKPGTHQQNFHLMSQQKALCPSQAPGSALCRGWRRLRFKYNSRENSDARAHAQWTVSPQLQRSVCRCFPVLPASQGQNPPVVPPAMCSPLSALRPLGIICSCLSSQKSPPSPWWVCSCACALPPGCLKLAGSSLRCWVRANHPPLCMAPPVGLMG